MWVGLTCFEISHGRVTAPKSHAVISIDLVCLNIYHILTADLAISVINFKSCRHSPEHVSMFFITPTELSRQNTLKELGSSSCMSNGL